MATSPQGPVLSTPYLSHYLLVRYVSSVFAVAFSADFVSFASRLSQFLLLIMSLLAAKRESWRPEQTRTIVPLAQRQPTSEIHTDVISEALSIGD